MNRESLYRYAVEWSPLMTGASWTYIIDALVRTPVTLFYAERAWLLMDRNKIFGAIVILLRWVLHVHELTTARPQ